MRCHVCCRGFLSYLGPSWALCWPFGPILGAPPAHVGGYVGPLGPSWAHLGLMLGAMLAHLGAYVGVL